MMHDLPPSRQMPLRTTQPIDTSLNRRTEHNIHVYAAQSRDVINRHIQELESEWSIERIIQATASVLAIIGIVLGAFVSSWFLVLPVIICSFFLAHAVLRFCPALSLLQGKGTRTNSEIDTEKFAMKALRGDGVTLPSDKDKATFAERIVEAARAYSSSN